MKKIFVFFVVVAISAITVLGTSTAKADGIITWVGNGSENLPCEYGGHWVLAPSFNITSAILTVDGVNYPMIQHGNGSWSADSEGSLSSDLSAWVEFVGEGDEKNHLQLSHCIEGGPTNTPTDDPTATQTEIFTETPTETPTNTPTDTATETPVSTETSVPTSTPNPSETPASTSTPDPTDTPTWLPTLPPPPRGTPQILPKTGGDLSSTGNWWVIGLGLWLVVAGMVLKFKKHSA